MALLIFCCSANEDQSQSAENYTIEGKWILDNFPNTMYEFHDGVRTTKYCVDTDCNTWTEADWDAAEALPMTHNYTFENNSLTIDLNFGNTFQETVQFQCNGQRVNFVESQQNWYRIGFSEVNCN